MLEQTCKASTSSLAKASTAKKARTKLSAPLEQREGILTWFQISFSCSLTGRYIASSKRRLVWKFGSIVSNHASDRDDFEEHEVVLVWSVKSGKTKLIWNGQDISSVFRDFASRRPSVSKLDFTWRSPRNAHFRVIAHANPIEKSGQYDLFVDETSFFLLPKHEDCFRRRIEELNEECFPEFIEIVQSDEFENRIDRAVSVEFAGSGGEMSGNGEDDPQQRSRLAAAGFSHRYGIVEDELRSDLYSSTLDFLRDEVSSVVPVSEEMISRAIINAFSEDHDSDTSHDSYYLQSDGYLCHSEVEADVLGELFEWLKWSRDFLPALDLRERKLEYMQRHVELMVSHVRHDRLRVSLAFQIMHRVAAILNLEVTRAPAFDTIMFQHLNSLTTTSDLVDAMQPYGEVTLAAVSKRHEGFGFCRFVSCESVNAVCSAGENGMLEINGRKPNVYDIFCSPYGCDVDERTLEPGDSGYDALDDIDVYQRDCIDPSDDGIEATYNANFRTARFHIDSPSVKNLSTGGGNDGPTINVHDFRSNDLVCR